MYSLYSACLISSVVSRISMCYHFIRLCWYGTLYANAMSAIHCNKWRFQSIIAIIPDNFFIASIICITLADIFNWLMNALIFKSTYVISISRNYNMFSIKMIRTKESKDSILTMSVIYFNTAHIINFIHVVPS